MQMIVRALQHNHWLLVALVVLPQAAMGREGLYLPSRSEPVAVAAAWDKTFVLLEINGSHVRNGTAFLVAKKEDGEQVELSFLTADHLLKNCRVGNVCANASLISNIQLSGVPKTLGLRRTLFQLWSILSEGFYVFRHGLTLEQIQTVQRDPKHDVALISVRVDQVAASSLPEPFSFSEECDSTAEGSPLYSVGFPDTTLRKNSNMLPIRRQSEMTKRWSTGVLAGYRDTEEGRVTSATVDGIVGSSGAPIFDVHGQIVTMVAVGTSGPPDNFAYVGVETPSQLRPQVIGTACGNLRRILDQ